MLEKRIETGVFYAQLTNRVFAGPTLIEYSVIYKNIAVFAVRRWPVRNEVTVSIKFPVALSPSEFNDLHRLICVCVDRLKEIG